MFYVYGTQFLRDEHKTIRGLFRQFENCEDEREKERIAREVIGHIDVHSRIEREIFYPALSDQGDGRAAARTARSIQEHDSIDEVLDQLQPHPLHGERFEALMIRLISEVEDHVHEEEEDVFPLAEKLLSMKMGELGMKMAHRKEELLQEGYGQVA